MKQQILDRLTNIISSLGIADPEIKLEYPENLEHGDFSSNIALAYAKQLKISPKELAEKIVEGFKTDLKSNGEGSINDFIADISIAGPGFINFKLRDEVFAKEILDISSGKIFNHYYAEGQNEKITGSSLRSSTDGKLSNDKILIEYTDPNTFKAFHIGHLMSNAIGESIARLIEHLGATVIRLCYPSDIGLHIAKSIWAMQNNLASIPSEAAPIEERTAFLGRMYVEGTKAYDADPTAKNEIDELNQAIYDKSDEAVNELYEKGRKWSLDHFDMLYDRLGTKFVDQIFESEAAPVGLEVVRTFTRPLSESRKSEVESRKSEVESQKSNAESPESEVRSQKLGGGNNKLDETKGEVFEESDGAIVFKGDKYGLHTRVFISSKGLPTYETKDVGLNIIKFKKYPDTTKSLIITANEQNDYFKVLIKVLSLIDEKNGNKTLHIGHGMLRFSSGKMSSRTGNVVTADALIEELRDMVKKKIIDRGFSVEEVDEISDIVAIGAIKYTILRQAIGGNVVFDSVASISFEGDSGPYLQYSAVRARSVLEKAGSIPNDENNANVAQPKLPEHAGLLEKLLTRFTDISERARNEYAPQILASYLISLAGAFNSFYATQTIIDEKDPLSAYRILLTKAFLITMTQGLWLLGIKVPKKM